jgi:hypothetical protein
MVPGEEQDVLLSTISAPALAMGGRLIVVEELPVELSVFSFLHMGNNNDNAIQKKYVDSFVSNFMF